MAQNGIALSGQVQILDVVLNDTRHPVTDIPAGDLTVKMPTIFASTNDLDPTRNGIESLLNIQNASTGQLPYAGAPLAQELDALIPGGIFSFTYHL